eukprot:3941776-Rhodomonas_salina.2
MESMIESDSTWVIKSQSDVDISVRCCHLPPFALHQYHASCSAHVDSCWVLLVAGAELLQVRILQMLVRVWDLLS